MKLPIYFFLIACTASTSLVASDESTRSTKSASTPIHVTVEPAPTPNITVQAAAPPAVTVNLPEDSIWWRVLDVLVTVLGFIVAAGVIFWQMGRQHKSALLLQKENAREVLRSEVYDKLRLTIVNTENALVDAAGYARMIPFNLRNYRTQVSMGIDCAGGSPIVRDRAPELSGLHGQMVSAVAELLFIFDSYAIAIPELEVFKDALNSALHDAAEAFMPLHSKLIPVLPTELSSPRSHEPQNSQKLYHVPAPPDDRKLEQIQRLVDGYTFATDDIGRYVDDLRVEAQNTLLKDLFPGQRAPIRQPIDPAYKVIRVDQATELKRYFREESPWGKNIQVSKNKVQENLVADDKPAAKFKETEPI